jgi:HPt (histidine-containing phosphotransfer) domain-containing protein
MARSAALKKHQETEKRPQPVRPIDLVHLARQTMGDRGLECEVLRLFEQMIGVHYSRLEKAATRNDMMVNLHAIKGASAGVGAFALSALAKAADDELRAGTEPNRERVDDIGIAVEEVRAFIVTLLEHETA